MKPDLEKKYAEEEYIRNPEPYKMYMRALEGIFDFSIVESFADLGCSSGRLMEHLNRKYPHIDLFGFEYFEWAKKYASPSIKEHIHIGDLSKPLHQNKTYDIVNCTEVGEHIEKEGEEQLLTNLVSITNDILILTWSNEKHDGDGQHVNPRTKRYIINRLSKKGMTFWPEATRDFKSRLELLLDGVGHAWWHENVMVFKKIRFIPVKSRYFVQGIHTDDLGHKKYLSPSSLRNYGKTNLQACFKEIISTVRDAVAENKPLSILRASDGDYFFLREIERGSAAPGRRALTKRYADMNMSLFRSMFWHNDIITTNLGPESIWTWRTFISTELAEKVVRKLLNNKRLGLFTNKKVRFGIDLILRPLTFFGIIPSLMALLYAIKRGPLYLKKAEGLIWGNTIPCEAVYALISTKWIFKNFKNNIGIVASKEKIDLIKNLSEHEEYKNYLGISGFCEYIEIPQKGAADNVETLAKSYEETLKHSKAKIFLVGAGSSKLALIPLLQMYSDAVFIDVGAGIDAIAGVVCQERPFFATWKNYRLKNFDYSTIDFMDQGNPAWNKKEYVTEFL